AWNVPGTEIRILRVSEGALAGQYLFSRETVRQLNDFYEAIRDRPNLTDSGEDFYDFYSMSPGSLLPPKWYGLIETLPPFFRKEMSGQAVWQWIGLAMTLGLAFLTVLTARR